LNICFRVDASVNIGSGHVMRCVTLAEQLRKYGAEIFFICREHSGNLIEWIRTEKKFAVYLLPKTDGTKNYSHSHDILSWLGASYNIDAAETRNIIESIDLKVDWLIVDHYSIDIYWEQLLRDSVEEIMVIDDLANRYHDCDLLLDVNLHRNMEQRYQSYIPDHCITLLGPKFALLRDEFYDIVHKTRDGNIKRILIFYGGSDPTNETDKMLQALQPVLPKEVKLDVVIGRINQHKDQIQSKVRRLPNASYYCQVDHMASLMNEADLVIGAGGGTQWERCFLGLPSIVTVVAENQYEITQAVEGTGAILNLGWYHQSNDIDKQEAITYALNFPEEIKQMGLNAKAIISAQHSSGMHPVVQHVMRDDI
jgi:UDP-2,4-diacetamido-2,4,6-trideoxy-beta-L-altropyranose hydrolase